MSAQPRERSHTALLLMLLLGCGLAGAGVWIGRLSVTRPLLERLKMLRVGSSYGELISEDRRDGVAAAYFDPDDARRNLHNFSWAQPNVMTPFVGHGPEPGRNLNAAINAWQCRGRAPIVMPKPPGVFRIFMTGASVLFGSGASSDDNTIASRLQARLNTEPSDTAPRYEVFALANPGWASTHERIVIENRVIDWAPDLVISLSGTSDIVWSQCRRNVLWFRSYHDDVFFSVLNDILENAGHRRMPDVAWPERDPIPPETVADRLCWNMRLACHALALKGVPTVFVLQPALCVTKKPLSAREQTLANATEVDSAYYAACCAAIRRQFAELTLDGFLFDDLTAVFDDATAQDEIFLDAFHVGDHGNDRLAARIHQVIRPMLAQ